MSGISGNTSSLAPKETDLMSCGNWSGTDLVPKDHESPEIPNFGIKGKGEILKEGEVLAIEPMITTYQHIIYLDKDLWTWKTKDGSLSAHFEHTVIVTKTGAEIITKIQD